MTENPRMDRIEKAIDTLVPMVATLAANQLAQSADISEHKEEIKLLASRANKLSLVVAGLIAAGGAGIKAMAANVWPTV